MQSKYNSNADPAQKWPYDSSASQRQETSCSCLFLNVKLYFCIYAAKHPPKKRAFLCRCFPQLDARSYQPVGHFCHQKPPWTQHAEPGAGRHPGTPWHGRLLCTEGVGLPGGGARWKPAAQTCEERLLKSLEDQPGQRRSTAPTSRFS